MGDNFFIAFLYENEGVALDESEFLKAVYLELKTDNVEEMKRNIAAFGVKVLEVPDPHLYFKPQEDKFCGWSESTRTSPNMKGPSTANSSPGWRSNESANALTATRGTRARHAARAPDRQPCHKSGHMISGAAVPWPER
jgi:hypothetical protein